MSELKKPDGKQPKESVSSGGKAEKKAAAPAKKKGDGLFKRLPRWFKELKGELKKVTWPSGKDTMKNVGVVIACVLMVGILIWTYDFVIRQVIDALLNLLG